MLFADDREEAAVEESFEQIIQQHLDLKRRNSHLDETQPLDGYRLDEGVFDLERDRGAAADRPKSRRSSHAKPESLLESFEDVWSAPEFDWGDKQPPSS